MKLFIVFVLIAAVTSENENDTSFNTTANNTLSRKHFGLSFNNRCPKPRVVFKCMTTCKSIGFQIFRLNFRCNCSCHALKTTTILPFFKWRTNGTTKTLGTTRRPRIFEIYGPMFHSLETTIKVEKNESENITCPPWPSIDANATSKNNSNATSDGNVSSEGGNSTANETNDTTIATGENNTTNENNTNENNTNENDTNGTNTTG
ncbi:hypothetical protein O0L34_g1264 [Tuta absoluta]|nr:hypothetical protein O0L34_g1264 [Tuta absoluta]